MIVPANPRHLNDILAIANQVRFDPDAEQDLGSIGYVLSPEEYLSRMQGNKYFYVSSYGKMQGFLLCYDNEKLEKMVAEGHFFHDGILPFLEKQEKPFIYGETIAIRPSSARDKVGLKMMGKLFYDMDQNEIADMYVLLRHGPSRNQASIDFCKQMKFVFTGEEIMNSDQYFTWGIYTTKA